MLAQSSFISNKQVLTKYLTKICYIYINNTYTRSSIPILFTWHLPGCPVIRTMCCHCQGPRFNPGQGTKIPQPCGMAKKIFLIILFINN